MPAAWTPTVRADVVLNTKSLGSDSMLPSKATPTTRPNRSIMGLPLLPPVMSVVATKFRNVAMSIRSRPWTQRRCRSHGSSPRKASDRAYMPR